MRPAAAVAGAVLAVGAGCASRQQAPGAGPPAGLEATGAAPDAAALAGRARAAVRRLEQETDGQARKALVAEAVDAGRGCERVAPGTAGCDYALALALGVEAREHPSGALQRLPEMVRLLRSADGQEPRLDAAGPSRVLALLLLRAPGWPLGPGDPEAALDAARRAVELAPDHAPNQLALAEALRAAGDEAGAVGAAQRGVELARLAAAAGDPDAAGWRRDGERLLEHLR